MLNIFQRKSENKNVETKNPSPSSDNESVETLSLENESLSLDNESKSEKSEKAKRLVLTKIKESPFNNNNNSLFIITGKGKLNLNGTGWSGKKFNEFPELMQDDSIKHLVSGIPVSGLGTYKVLIKKIGDTDVYKDIKLKDNLEENAKSEDIIHKMSLVGYYMLGIKSNSTYLASEAEKWYEEAIKWCQEADKLGSIEAKLCLEYMYSIGFNTSSYDPQKAKELFKEVIKAVDKTEVATANREVLTEELLTKQKLEIAMKWYEKSCELGDSQSAYYLGLLYESDHEIKNEDETVKWFKMAVKLDKNHLYAKAKLGRNLINKDNGQAFLGDAYERGQIGKEINTKEAIKFYFKAAEQNSGYYSHVAQFRLKNFRALEIIPAGEKIENVLKLYVEELKYYYDNDEKMLENIH
ncbi:protein kinase [Rhizophagus clarus]|uniref:Protein kinase n=1 Tax=Rhizophagus clarus TaxID=94130 RepID=A0A8H3QYZ0_9GLOM|nr:protein kinase [Rhizophagus clarus]